MNQLKSSEQSRTKAYGIIWQLHELRNEFFLLGLIGLSRNHVSNCFVKGMNLKKWQVSIKHSNAERRKSLPVEATDRR